MKLRVVAFAACLLALASPLPFAQSATGGLSPDKAEIESASSAGIVFVNYEGPSARIDSIADITGIGSALGKAVVAGGPGPVRTGDAARYRVIRAIDPSVKEGLDADIIVLGPDAQIDHIRNLRWIIAGYLSSAWGYSGKDAYTLATFITIYDAVHRGDVKYFSSKYKAVVMKELSPENAGLALSYAEWPGKSRIVIPLSAGAKPGSLGSVDTGAVSDKAVAQSLKAQSDKGVADRQALVDVKEREAAQKQAEADKQKADLAAAEKKLAADKAKAEADRAALEAEKAAAAKTAAATPTTTPATTPAAAAAPANESPATTPAPAADASGTPASADLTTKEAAVKAEEAAVKAKEADVAAKKDEAGKTEAAATAKKEEAAADRKDITVDQKQVIAAQVADKGKSEAAGVFLFRVGNDANHLAQVVFVDADTGKGIRSSRINTLHLRSLAELSDSFAAVSGLEGKAGGVKLVKLDKSSLESVAESKADMFPESSVLVSGDALYAIVKAADGKQYLAAFAAADLAEKARSKAAVAPYTFIRQVSGGIAVQSPTDGSFMVLKTDTLEKVKDLKP